MAVLLQRRDDGRGFSRIAGVAAAREDIGPLGFAVSQLVSGSGHDQDVLGGDGRILAHWLDGLDRRMILVVARRDGAPPFLRREVDAIVADASWLTDVAVMWWQNQRAAARLEGLRAAFGLRGTGAILLDGHGAIIEVNDHAHRLLSRHSGLLRNDERLTAELPRDATALTAAVRAVIGAAVTGRRIAPRQLSVQRGREGAPLHLSVMRPYETAALRIEPGDPAVLLLVVDPSAATAATTGVCSLYGLTPAQSRLTRRLAEGDSLAEAATALGLTCETARTYLKQVFAKTGVRRQATLVRMMLMGQVPAQRSRSYTRDAAQATERPVFLVAQETAGTRRKSAVPMAADPGQLMLALR